MSVSAYIAPIKPRVSVVPPTTTVAVTTKVTTKPAAPKVAPAPTPVVKPKPAPVPTPVPVVVPSPSSNVNGLTPVSPPPAQAPAPAPLNPTATSYTSTNWSGYMATTGSFTAISGSWVATQPTGNGATTSADGTWIGIGGVSTSDLIQVGTENTINTSGQVSTAAFYELLPATAQFISTMIVKPGDSMHASLTEAGGQWTITITDITSGQTFTTSVAYTSSFSSAEWIQEAPSYSSGKQIPLDNFGTVPFTGGSTTNAGKVVNLTGVNAQKITMVDGSGRAIASPSVISSDGASFSVSRN